MAPGITLTQDPGQIQDMSSEDNQMTVHGVYTVSQMKGFSLKLTMFPLFVNCNKFLYISREALEMFELSGLGEFSSSQLRPTPHLK